MEEALVSSETPEHEMWSNKECLKIAFKEFFQISVKNTNVQKGILNRFLNFYLGGKVPKNLTVGDILFATIAIMPSSVNSNEYIWPDYEYRHDGSLFNLLQEAIATESADVNNENRDHSLQCDQPDENLTAQPQIPTEAHKPNVTQNPSEETVNNHENKNVSHNLQQPDQVISNRIGSNTSLNVENESEIRSENFSNIKNEPEIGSDILSEVENEPMPDYSLPENMIWLKTASKTASQPEITTYTVEHNIKFIQACHSILNTNEIVLIRFLFGILALTLMRGLTKGHKHLTNTFSSKLYRVILYLFGWNCSFTTPHKRCIRKCYNFLRSHNHKVSVMFAKIVCRSHVESMVFMITVLTHTCDYGMGILSLLKVIKSKFGEECLDYVYKNTLCKDTEKSWKTIIRFMNEYMIPSQHQWSYHWARVIRPESFQYLSCGNNYVLAVILAVFGGDSGVWDSHWIGVDKENFEELKKLGEKMFEKFNVDLREAFF